MANRLGKVLILSGAFISTYGSLQLALPSSSLKELVVDIQGGDVSKCQRFVQLLQSRGVMELERNRDFIQDFAFSHDQSEELANLFLAATGMAETEVQEMVSCLHRTVYLDLEVKGVTDACFFENGLLIHVPLNDHAYVVEFPFGGLWRQTHALKPRGVIEKSMPMNIVPGKGCYASLVSYEGRQVAWLYAADNNVNKWEISELIRVSSTRSSWALKESEDARFIAVGMQGCIALVDSTTQNCIRIEEALLTENRGADLFFTANNKWLVAVISNRYVRAWNIARCLEAHGLIVAKADFEYGFEGSVEKLDCFGENSIVVAHQVLQGCGMQRKITGVELDSGIQESFDSSLQGEVLCFHPCVHGAHLVSLPGGGLALKDNSQRRFLDCAERIVQACFHPQENNFVVALSDSSSVYVWDLSHTSSRPLYTLPATGIKRILCDPNGSYLLGIAEDMIRLWDWDFITKFNLTKAFLVYYCATIQGEVRDGCSADSLFTLLDSKWFRYLCDYLKSPSRLSMLSLEDSSIESITTSLTRMKLPSNRLVPASEDRFCYVVPPHFSIVDKQGKSYLVNDSSTNLVNAFEISVQEYLVTHEPGRTILSCGTEQAKEAIAIFTRDMLRLESGEVGRRTLKAKRRVASDSYLDSTSSTIRSLFDTVWHVIKDRTEVENITLPDPNDLDDVNKTMIHILTILSRIDLELAQVRTELEQWDTQNQMIVACKEREKAQKREGFRIKRVLMKVLNQFRNEQLQQVVNEINECGKTALHYAAEIGNFYMVKKLLMNGASQVGSVNPLQPLKPGESVLPFVRAAACGRIKIVKELERDASVGSVQRAKAIMEAAYFGHTAIIEHLCQMSIPFDVLSLCDYSARSTKGWSVLHYAAAGPREELLRHLVKCLDISALKPLLELKAILGSKRNGSTPFEVAAWYGRTRHVELLLNEAKQCGLYMDKEYNTAFCQACTEPGGLPVVQLLDEFSETTGLLSNTSRRLGLCQAAGAGNIEIVEYLLAGKKVSVSSCGRQQMTPLHNAAMYGKLSMVKMLLDRGAQVFAMDSNGDTPMELVNNGLEYAEEIRELLRHAGEQQKRSVAAKRAQRRGSSRPLPTRKKY